MCKLDSTLLSPINTMGFNRVSLSLSLAGHVSLFELCTRVVGETVFVVAMAGSISR